MHITLGVPVRFELWQVIVSAVGGSVGLSPTVQSTQTQGTLGVNVKNHDKRHAETPY